MEMKIVFNGFWHGPELTVIHKTCLQSFVDFGHDYELYCYRRLDAGPAILRDAAEVMAESEIFYFSNLGGEANIAAFSDLFRLKLLLQKGGWWCDVDTICLSDAIPVWERAWARECPEIDPAGVSNGVIRFPAGDPILRELYEE